MVQHDPLRLTDAFPESLRSQVLAVITAIPAPPHQLGPTGTIGPITIDGRPIRIPFRVYSDELAPSDFASLTQLDQSIAACLYTRHHDGHVRERALKHALRIDEVWAAPFVIQLLGEYVIEIVEAVVLGLTEVRREPYAAFLRENRGFLDLTEQRATSYWDVYFRGRFPLRRDYPALVALNALRASAGLERSTRIRSKDPPGS